jgi:hypothetical protein
MTDQFGREVTLDGVEGRGQSFVLALLAGVFAAVLGALVWMGVQVAMHLKIGFVAIAIGALVGLAIRLAGNGRGALFGILGAVLTFAGCLGGEILANLYEASSPQQSMLDLAKSVDYPQMISVIFSKMDPIGYLIYGIGIFEGYKLSMRK